MSRVPSHTELTARLAKLQAELAAFKQQAKRSPKRANVHGGSGQQDRGAWCTPQKWALRVGPWDLDPFSNLRSHIVSDASCALERGDDGFGDGSPGSYRIARLGLLRASAETRVWGQPDYQFVLRAFRHYQHTRWCWLLRFDPSTEWFSAIYAHSRLVCVPRERLDFEPPPGVAASSNPFPHALFFRDERDATDDVLRHCIAWRKRSVD